MPLDKKKRPAMLPSSIKRMLFNYPLNEKTKQPIKHLVDVKNMHVHSSQEVSREYGSSLVFAYTQQRAVDYVAQSSFCQDLLQQYHYRDNYNYSQDTYRLSSSRISHRS